VTPTFAALPAVVTWISTINELFDLTKAVVLEMSE